MHTSQMPTRKAIASPGQSQLAYKIERIRPTTMPNRLVWAVFACMGFWLAYACVFVG